MFQARMWPMSILKVNKYISSAPKSCEAIHFVVALKEKHSPRTENSLTGYSIFF